MNSEELEAQNIGGDRKGKGAREDGKTKNSKAQRILNQSNTE